MGATPHLPICGCVTTAMTTIPWNRCRHASKRGMPQCRRTTLARVTLVAEEALSPGVQCYIGQTADGVLRGLGGHRPELAERWLALYLPLVREDGALPVELK